jgi:hypothetical protein
MLSVPRCHSGILLGEQLIRLVSWLLHTTAVAQIGSATLVQVLSGFMPLYVWGLAIATRHETVRTHELWRRLLALMMLLGSSYLMATR